MNSYNRNLHSTAYIIYMRALAIGFFMREKKNWFRFVRAFQALITTKQYTLGGFTILIIIFSRSQKSKPPYLLSRELRADPTSYSESASYNDDFFPIPASPSLFFKTLERQYCLTRKTSFFLTLESPYCLTRTSFLVSYE